MASATDYLPRFQPHRATGANAEGVLLRLKEFLSCNSDPSEIDFDPSNMMKNLWKIVGKNVPLEDLINAVFDVCSREFFPAVIEAIISENPSLRLSPQNEIRRAIVLDKKYHLNNKSLMEMIAELGGDQSESTMNAYYELAYRMKHPYLYRPGVTSPDQYTLNFLWINLDPQDRVRNIAKNIFGKGSNLGENNQESGSFTHSLSQWAELNPGVRMHLWCDSALVTQQAWDRTAAVLAQISQQKKVDLTLRDIRQIPVVRDHTTNFFHPGMPVYARVDAAKVAIGYHLMSDESFRCCVFADRDIEPMRPEHLFDERTQRYLDLFGYVFNPDGAIGFENSFFMLDGTKQPLKEAHLRMLQNAATTLEKLATCPLEDDSFRSEDDEPPLGIDSQFIFDQYQFFKEEMEDGSNGEPRKPVKCPPSQFNFPQEFHPLDFQKETARFIGENRVPHTRWGRAGESGQEIQIPALQNWKCQPLEL